MINLIPYISFGMKSSNTKIKILANFRKHIDIVETLPIAKTTSHKDYQGILYDNGFIFRRVFKLGYSAFMPTLSCKIDEQVQGVFLKVKIKFPNYINIGLLLYLIFQIVFFTNDFISISMLIIPYFVILILFNSETQLLKRMFRDIVVKEPR